MHVLHQEIKLYNSANTSAIEGLSMLLKKIKEDILIYVEICKSMGHQMFRQRIKISCKLKKKTLTKSN